MKILCFDVESNGLHGDAFAVAGVVIGDDSRIISQIVARSPIIGPVDTWVSDNVLGPMKNIPESHATSKLMRGAFWKWYTLAKADVDVIVAANPYPVEARFLISCQEDDLPAREFEHPFPFYDLSSMLYTLGFTTPALRRGFVERATADASGEAHNPLWDATATAMAALQAINQPSGLPQVPTP